MHGLPSLDEILADEAAARDDAWASLLAELGVEGSDAEVAELVLDVPSEHPWRVVDAALDRLVCPKCGSVLGAGSRGCVPCDMADGSRFLGQEPDRHAVPAGNEHAVRVSVAVVRHPHRWRTDILRCNWIYLPLFVAGDMPTKAERYELLAAVRAGHGDELAGAPSFAAMAERARRLSGAMDAVE